MKTYNVRVTFFDDIDDEKQSMIVLNIKAKSKTAATALVVERDLKDVKNWATVEAFEIKSKTGQLFT